MMTTPTDNPTEPWLRQPGESDRDYALLSVSSLWVPPSALSTRPGSLNR
jgi:hypothetical protein